MHVEVNETNIALYELVKLTGNSEEDLLKAAKEAQKSGYTLCCQISDEVIEVNAFEHFYSEPAPKVRDDGFTYEKESGDILHIDDEGIEIVKIEIAEEDRDD